MNILPKNVKTSAPHCETSNLSNALFFSTGLGIFLVVSSIFLFQLLLAFCIQGSRFKVCHFFAHILAVAPENKAKKLKLNMMYFQLERTTNTRNSDIQ